MNTLTKTQTPTHDNALQGTRERLERDKAEFNDGQYDQSIRDREYLLSLLDGAK